MDTFIDLLILAVIVPVALGYIFLMIWPVGLFFWTLYCFSRKIWKSWPQSRWLPSHQLELERTLRGAQSQNRSPLNATPSPYGDYSSLYIHSHKIYSMNDDRKYYS